MNTTLMYIHGYGSTGNAIKAQLLHDMFPNARLVAPTFDYDHVPPQEVYRQLQEIIANESPNSLSAAARAATTPYAAPNSSTARCGA